MSTLTPTTYIPVPISEPPPQEGYYHTIGSELVAYWHSDQKYQEVYKETKGWDAKVTHWLRPIDLSKMLEECWNAALAHKYYEAVKDSGLSSITAFPDMNTYINSVLNPPKMTEEQLTKDWQEYSGYYCKAMQDVRLSNGDEIMMCWPNAGVWNVCSDGPYKNQEIKNSDVTHVRKTHDKNW